MRKRIILWYILIGITANLYAQSFTIEGMVLDEKRNAIEYANVMFMQPDSTIIAKTSAGSNGYFSLSASKKGDYILHVSHLGYDTQIMRLKGLDKRTKLPDIILRKATTVLQEVVVKAQSVVQQTDKTLIFPTSQQKKYAVDGFSLLNNLMLPQIDVNLLNKTVSSRGKTVTLLINGKPVKDKNEVAALLPQDILRIEYHELPTGVYAEYESVIDYITRQYKRGGYISFSGLQHTSLAAGDYFIMGRFNHDKSEHSVGYEIDYTTDTETYRENTERFVYPDETTLSRRETGEPSTDKERIHHVFYNYNYRNTDNQFNAKIGYKKAVSGQDYQSLLHYDKAFQTLTQQLSEFNHETQENPYLSLYGNIKLKNNQSLILRGDIDYSKNQYSYLYTESGEGHVSANNPVETRTTENYWHAVVGLNFKKSFDKSHGISINYYNFSDISNSLYLNNNSANRDRLVSSENLLSLTYSKRWNKTLLSFKLGMSALVYKQKGQADKVFWSGRPQITFRHIFNKKHSLQFRTDLSNSFPTLDLFTNSEQAIDFMQKRRGNPSLGITKIFGNLLSYSYTTNRFSLNAMIDHFHSWPNTSRCVFYENGYFVHSYQKGGTYNFVNSAIGISLNLVDNLLRLKVNGGLKRYDINVDKEIHLNNWYVNSNLMIYHKNFHANIYYYSSQKGAYAGLDQWENSARYGLFLTYNTKRYSLTLGTQNPFSGYHRSIQTFLDIYSRQSILFNAQNDHLFFIKATLNLDFGRTYKYSRIDNQKQSHSAILKNSKDL